MTASASEALSTATPSCTTATRSSRDCMPTLSNTSHLCGSAFMKFFVKVSLFIFPYVFIAPFHAHPSQIFYSQKKTKSKSVCGFEGRHEQTLKSVKKENRGVRKTELKNRKSTLLDLSNLLKNNGCCKERSSHKRYEGAGVLVKGFHGDSKDSVAAVVARTKYLSEVEPNRCNLWCHS